MNLQELKKRAFGMSAKELEDLREEFGGTFTRPEELVRSFVDNADHPHYERRLCQLLELSTEEEKRTAATLRAAAAAEKSASSAKLSAAASVVSVAVALAMVLVHRGCSLS